MEKQTKFSQKYIEFIKSWSKIYNIGFPIFIAVLATVFINIFTNNTPITITKVFDKSFLLLFIFYALTAILFSLIITMILYGIFVFIFGSTVFLMKELNEIILENYSWLGVFLFNLFLLIMGFKLFFIHRLSTFGIVGLILILLSISPIYLKVKTKIEVKSPSYVG